MAKILQHPRVYSFLHVPVQSASDSVLMDMKREYCQADFRHVADFLKERYMLLVNFYCFSFWFFFKITVVNCLIKNIYKNSVFHRVPGVTIATDVICGFPTETEEVSYSSISRI